MTEDYLNDPEFIIIRREYLDDLRAKAPENLASAQAGNFEPVRTFGHNLKGNGTSFGFQRISELGADIEKAAIEGAQDILLDRLPKLIEFLGEVTL
ncbi:MAG TPA: hypothetical protein DHU63_00395 [Candidatus Marinimicrobia bacterium]|nr:MAG: hypothetical protein AUJ47_03770 [Candidatus Marinimicrobia bacterium CG1_02_48_14]PIZ67797.1 MAG: hypothetical protein COY19_04900 [Candidatus Marinimicrobia bacterium CG_4_10_14_0_2_um_filter_48_9]PJA54567.1 MAG: hypothetical protein CO167_03105 [Candidatus Marinimicrobia bacterium CG_4_9_14_3_um_filter_48_9]HCW74980.1 hypothetical protein [Candidatus Neomarinimicrobiota bacterium]